MGLILQRTRKYGSAARSCNTFKQIADDETATGKSEKKMFSSFLYVVGSVHFNAFTVLAPALSQCFSLKSF